MALNQTNKLVWIVETIYRAHKISFEELNRRWMDNVDLSRGEEMLKRTFHKWKWNIFDTFGLSIDCEKTAPYRYYIANEDDMKSGSIGNWLLSTLSVSNFLLESKSIKNRIILEDVPSGREYLEQIIDAMKKNRFIHINYFNYWKGDTHDHYVMPLCVKLFRQRWYLLGRNWPAGYDLVFCLDRIQNFRLSSVIPGDGTDIEKVKIKVSASQANYLRDLPLHESQQETEQTDEYSIFELHVRPTFEFQQELLWSGENLEVLEPLWLRREIAEKVNRMWNKYKKEFYLHC